MPDVLTLKAHHFELTVWTKDIGKSQVQLFKTHATRGLAPPTSSLRFNPELAVVNVIPPSVQSAGLLPRAELQLSAPLFFENKQYEFEFHFDRDVDRTSPPSITHRLQSVEEAFHYKSGFLRGSINFGNDVGWFRIGVKYRIANQEIVQYLSFEVFPIKMSMVEDLARIHQAVDEFYPLWRFSFAQKTEQELSKSRRAHERFELLWLAHFENLRNELEKWTQRICREPHTRLLPHQYHMRAERLRGRLQSKLEQEVEQHLSNGQSHHRYRVVGKRLSIDTPENRFVKMVLIKSTQAITHFIGRARQINHSPESSRISESFFTVLEGWKRPLDQLLSRQFFAEVGPFEGLTTESLVLHQRSGYAAVYRIWQELKLYLNLFGYGGSISMKSVAELYEVWCLLEVRQMLLRLGFKESSGSRALLSASELTKHLSDGIGAAFHFSRDDGTKIRLAHEPIFLLFRNPVIGKIYSWTTVQKPDIFLEATFRNGDKAQWIFDAKYRIADDQGSVDLAPDDAINQMHRYRDALIYLHEAEDGEMEKRRPILGAFVLFPGWVDELLAANPYRDSIDAVGIGGFPLLPGRPNKWLFDFLAARLGSITDSLEIADPDCLLVEDSARIAPLGLYLERYADLTLIARLNAVPSDLDEGYVHRLLVGSAGWYHIPLKHTDKMSSARNAIREVRYCAIAVLQNGYRHIATHIYEVESVRVVKRCDLSVVQAGKLDDSDKAECWLFKLGASRRLPQPLNMPGALTEYVFAEATEVLVAKNWDDLPKRYVGLC